MEPITARKMWRTLEPYHGMIYFVPEAAAAYEAAGIASAGSAGYFASRAAPMGAVPAEVVIATFFNFYPPLVKAAVPACWEACAPASLVKARFGAADGALRRILGNAVSSPEMEEAATLAHKAASAPTMSASGRPLYAGYASLAWPSEPHLVLWHALSILREYRGDGHISMLTGYGIDGCEALVCHAASGEVPKAALVATRQWPAEDWEAAVARLTKRGLLDDMGAFTETGIAFRQRIEDQTDLLALAPWEHLGAAGCDRLRELVRPWSRAIVEGGGLAGLGGRQ